MERTSRVLSRCGFLGVMTLVFVLVGIEHASAQCPAPSGLTSLNIQENSAQLRWTSNDTPTDNCWVVTVGGVGTVTNAAGCPDGGQALITATVCSPGTGTTLTSSHPQVTATRSSQQITATVTGLPPGTALNYYVSETCDGFAPPNNVSSCAGPGSFTTLGTAPTGEVPTPSPTELTTVSTAESSATVRWTSNDTPTDNCWVLTAGGVGMVVNAANCPDGGQALVEATLCNLGGGAELSSSNPLVTATRDGQQITATLSGLPPGTVMNWYVSETRDSSAPPNNVSTCSGPGTFTVGGVAGPASSPVPAPTGQIAFNTGQSSTVLRWTSGSTPTDNCWVLSVGGVGQVTNAANCHDGGQTLVRATLCNLGGGSSLTSSHPWVTATRSGQQITATVSGLPAGTTLNWHVSETADGGAPPNNVSTCAGPATFMTLDAQYTVTVVTSRPSCPKVSPGYVSNGSFTVTVTNGSTCGGTYNVDARPIAGSGPGGSTPPSTTVVTYIGFGAGNNNFNNAGAGSYIVTVTETATCNPGTDPVVMIVTVPDGIDNTPPIFDVLRVVLISQEIEGEVYEYYDTVTVADNAPWTPAGTSVNLGTLGAMDGECSAHDPFMVSGMDNCDGFIVASNAVSATASLTPASSGFDTQALVTSDGQGVYTIDVHWGIGASTVSIFGRDASGNVAGGANGLRLEATVPNSTPPMVMCPAADQVFFGEMYVPTANGGRELKAFRCLISAPGAAPVCEVDADGVLEAYPPMCEGAF